MRVRVDAVSVRLRAKVHVRRLVLLGIKIARIVHVIHKFKFKGKNIVLDVNSGCIHLVDDVVFDILEVYVPFSSVEQNLKLCAHLVSKYGEDEVRGAVSEINFLVDSSKLFSTFKFEPIKEINSPIKSMCLNVSHDCQLRCKYCFASHGNFGGKRMLMSSVTAKNAIDFLVRNSSNRKNLEVDFFGGEPLMNFSVVRETVRYARSLEKLFNKNFRFTITTNGIALDDDKINFINAEMHNVVLSIDGRKKINDFMRVFESGMGSYDVIIKKFQRLVNRRGEKEYFVRGTFTKNNLDFSKDVLHLFKMGFNRISMEPAVLDKSVEYSLENCDENRILEEYERLLELVMKLRIVDEDFVFFHFMHDFKKGPCAIKRLKGCGCGNEYVSISPEGNIYPCHQFVGISDFEMGNVNTNDFNYSMKKKFSIPNLCSSSECKNCWSKFFCGGGCSANNWSFNKSLDVPHKLSCDLMKKRMEMSIYMATCK